MSVPLVQKEALRRGVERPAPKAPFICGEGSEPSLKPAVWSVLCLPSPACHYGGLTHSRLGAVGPSPCAPVRKSAGGADLGRPTGSATVSDSGLRALRREAWEIL